jgi:hypothetical protein
MTWLASARTFVCLAIAMHSLAATASAWLAHVVRVIPVVDDAPAAPTRRSRGRVAYAAMVERNLFRAARASETVTSEPTEVADCTMPLELHGTLLAHGVPEWSLAVLRHAGEVLVRSINPGDNEVGEARVVEIRARGIVVERDGRRELCEVSADGPPRIGALQAAPPRAREVSLERIQDLERELPLARIVPRGGTLEVRSVRPESVLRELGLAAGDVIRSIDGAPPADPTRLLARYRALERGQTVVLEVERAGRPLRLEATIR